MKVLKESTEKLPISVVTDLVSEGWNEVGKLKSEIEAMKSFSGSKEVAEVLQKLTDSYLVCIGQLEAFLQDKKYVKDLDDLKEAVDIHIDDKEVTIADASGEEVGIIPIEPAKEDSEEEKEPEEEKEVEIETDDADDEVEIEVPNTHNTFDFFVDFDEPDMTKGPITDEEIEQLQKVGR